MYSIRTQIFKVAKPIHGRRWGDVGVTQANGGLASESQLNVRLRKKTLGRCDSGTSWT